MVLPVFGMKSLKFSTMRAMSICPSAGRKVANTVKMVGMRYMFQTIGEYNAILSLYNIRCEQTDGRVNGREYHIDWYFCRIVEPIVDGICRKLLAKSGTVQYCHSAVVDECHAVYASLQSSGGQHQSTIAQSVSDFGDYDLLIPGLDLFQPGQSFNPGVWVG